MVFALFEQFGMRYYDRIIMFGNPDDPYSDPNRDKCLVARVMMMYHFIAKKIVAFDIVTSLTYRIEKARSY